MVEKSVMIANAVLNLDEKEVFNYYSKKSSEIFKKAEGKLIGKYKATENLVGDNNFHVVVVMEFPNNQDIIDVFESEEYIKLIPFRDKAFRELKVFIGNQ